MAWEISMTAEGWSQVRHNLQCHTSREALIVGLTDSKFEEVEKFGGLGHAKRAADALKARIEALPINILANACMELIEKHNTCNNGGFAVWIDPEGYQTAPVSLQCDDLADKDDTNGACYRTDVDS